MKIIAGAKVFPSIAPREDSEDVIWGDGWQATRTGGECFLSFLRGTLVDKEEKITISHEEFSLLRDQKEKFIDLLKAHGVY